MTLVLVRSILGVGGLPSDRTSATRWLAARDVPVVVADGDGRKPEAVSLFDLPASVRRAYELRKAEAEGQEPRDYDDEAQARLLNATPAMQEAARRKAEIARLLTRAGATAAGGLSAELIRAAREKFGGKGTDQMTLRRILRAVDGVAPINFAPALLPDYKRDTAPRADMSPEVWSFFLTLLRDAYRDWPLTCAYDDVLDVAAKNG